MPPPDIDSRDLRRRGARLFLHVPGGEVAVHPHRGRVVPGGIPLARFIEVLEAHAPLLRVARANASLALSCATISADIASARLWRSWTIEAVVYVVFPSVNDPFGKCFCVPAMSACTRVSAAALVTFDVMLDMVLSLPS
jgi:hypothetical protein